MTLYSTRRPSPRPRPRGRQDTTATVPVPARTTATVAQELRNPAGDPPTYREVAARLGWDEAAARVNRWAAGGYEGDWHDAEYDDPSPRDLEGGDTRAHL